MVKTMENIKLVFTYVKIVKVGKIHQSRPTIFLLLFHDEVFIWILTCCAETLLDSVNQKNSILKILFFLLFFLTFFKTFSCFNLHSLWVYDITKHSQIKLIISTILISVQKNYFKSWGHDDAWPCCRCDGTVGWVYNMMWKRKGRGL